MTFTPTPPTEPGFYAWTETDGEQIELLQVYPSGGVMCCLVGALVEEFTVTERGLWCRLVPVEEVEKAFIEGWECCARAQKRRFSGKLDDWNNSRAKRVSEGKE